MNFRKKKFKFRPQSRILQFFNYFVKFFELLISYSVIIFVKVKMRITQNSILKLAYDHAISYPTPTNLTYYWNFGVYAIVSLTRKWFLVSFVKIFCFLTFSDLFGGLPLTTREYLGKIFDWSKITPWPHCPPTNDDYKMFAIMGCCAVILGVTYYCFFAYYGPRIKDLQDATDRANNLPPGTTANNHPRNRQPSTFLDLMKKYHEELQRDREEAYLNQPYHSNYYRPFENHYKFGSYPKYDKFGRECNEITGIPKKQLEEELRLTAKYKAEYNRAMKWLDECKKQNGGTFESTDPEIDQLTKEMLEEFGYDTSWWNFGYSVPTITKDEVRKKIDGLGDTLGVGQHKTGTYTGSKVEQVAYDYFEKFTSFLVHHYEQHIDFVIAFLWYGPVLAIGFQMLCVWIYYDYRFTLLFWKIYGSVMINFVKQVRVRMTYVSSDAWENPDPSAFEKKKKGSIVYNIGYFFLSLTALFKKLWRWLARRKKSRDSDG